MPRKRSIQSIQRQQRQRQSAEYKRRRTSKITAPIQQVDVADQNYDTLNVKLTATVQQIDAVEEIHRTETNTVPVQGIVAVAVDEVHPAGTDTTNNHVCYDDGNEPDEIQKDDTPTNNNPLPDLVPSLCEFIDRKKRLKQH